MLAERKVLDHALAFPHFTTALRFFIEWKEPRYAARLVLERTSEIDGNLYPGFPGWIGVWPAPGANLDGEIKPLRWTGRPSPEGRDG
jgi:hypothetical protein